MQQLSDCPPLSSGRLSGKARCTVASKSSVIRRELVRDMFERFAVVEEAAVVAETRANVDAEAVVAAVGAQLVAKAREWVRYAAWLSDHHAAAERDCYPELEYG